MEMEQYTQEIMFMKKPKPWNKYRLVSRISSERKGANIDRICRRISIENESNSISKGRRRCAGRKNASSRKLWPPFLLRNATKSNHQWSDYVSDMKWWHERRRKEKSNQSITAFCGQDRSETDQDIVMKTYYTVWNMNRINIRQCETVEQVHRSIMQLSRSDAVKKCMREIPTGGLEAERVTPAMNRKMDLRTRLDLARWSSLVRDESDDDAANHSGYEDDFLEVWNTHIENNESYSDLSSRFHADRTSASRRS